MAIWTSEIKELEKLYESLKGQLPDLEKELERLVKADDENMILLYSRRCLEVIIIDLCQCELKRERGTEPLKGIIDKLYKEHKVPDHIATSMHGLNDLSTYGTHPKDFDPEQVKPVLNNLSTIIKWYLKYKETGTDFKSKPVEEIRKEIKGIEDVKKSISISRKKWAGLLGGLIAIVASAFAVLYFSDITGSGKQTKKLEKSIAVLPFFNDSPDEENSHFINGIMEEILNNLQINKNLRVVSRSSVEQYRGEARPAIPKIAKQLDVNYIVEGSGQKYGNSVRLRVQLIEAVSDKHLWAESYEKEIKETKDIFDLQSKIAESIASELKAIITPEEKNLIEKTATLSLTAYDFYLRGNEKFAKYWGVKAPPKEILFNAEAMFKNALEQDPGFARAYVG
ncbi:MAG TPA: hypothetical protein DDW27_10175, partial [Bacteroidales bacterium]|nr:hypothetical protein [Bacteroidales bacterium]